MHGKERMRAINALVMPRLLARQLERILDRMLA